MQSAYRPLRAFALILLACLILVPSPGRSAVPQTISYQGSLSDASGDPVNEALLMTFSLYASSSAVTPLWTETRTVTVTNGTFHVILGATSESPLRSSVFEGPLYLGIAVGGDPEMTPRQALTSVGYAFRSAVAEAVVPGAVTGDGLAASSVTTEKIADGAVTAAKIGEPCLAGQVLKRGRLKWACAADDNDNTAVEAAVAGHEIRILDLEKAVADLQSGLTSALAAIGELQADLASAKVTIGGLTADLAAVQANSVLALDDLLTLDAAGAHPTARFTGVNVQVTNGVNQTTVNGTGNLVVGFNELRGIGDDRSGSHNLVVGSRQNYASYGGLVAGFSNTISGAYASVSGGEANTASGDFSGISGGSGLTISDADAWAAASLEDTPAALNITKSAGSLNLSGATGLTLLSGADLTQTSGGNMALQSSGPSGLDISSATDLGLLSGKNLNLQSSMNLNLLSGTDLSLLSTRDMSLRSSGPLGLSLTSDTELNLSSGDLMGLSSSGAMDLSSAYPMGLYSANQVDITSDGKMNLKAAGDMTLKASKIIQN
jgi:uncharacterized protein (DUF2345 family)